MGLGPATTDQIPVSAEQGVGLHEEPSQTSTAKEPTRSSEQRPIVRAKSRPGHLATEHGNLVAKHDELDGQFFVVMPNRTEQLEDSDEGKVEKRQGHGPVSLPETVPRKSW